MCTYTFKLQQDASRCCVVSLVRIKALRATLWKIKKEKPHVDHRNQVTLNSLPIGIMAPRWLPQSDCF